MSGRSLMFQFAAQVVRVASLLLGLAFVQAASAETALFVGNSFTFGAGSAVQHYRPETVTDLNHDSVGGVPALFKSFALQSGLDYDVSLETAGGKNLDYHFERKSALLARSWDHVLLQAYSTLDQEAPGDPSKLVDYSARLAALFRSWNPRVDLRLIATWSRADQTYRPDGHWFGQPIENMALDVRSACDLAMARSSLMAVVPVGQAWNAAIGSGLATRDPYRTIPRGQINLWADDAYHASVFGYYLEALVVFGSVTGRDPRSLGKQEASAAELGIEPATAVALQKIAFATLLKESRR
jgi:hypothetical protein